MQFLKNPKNSYILPLIVFFISALGVGYGLDDFTISADYIIPILVLMTLAIIFLIMRNCYIKYSWDKDANNLDGEAVLATEEKNRTVFEKIVLNFLKYFKGCGALPNAFFGYFVLGNFITLLLFIAASRGYRHLFGFEKYIDAIMVIVIVSGIFIISYFLLSVRIMWKCAGNSSYSGFYYIVRGVIILFLVIMIFALVEFVVDVGGA